MKETTIITALLAIILAGCSASMGTPGDNLIPVSTEFIFDMNGRSGKGIRGWFDGNRLTRLDANGVGDPYALPFVSFLVLPNVYKNIHIDHWDHYGEGGNIKVDLYSPSKRHLATYDMPKKGWQNWTTVDMSKHDSVRFIRFTAVKPEDLNAGIFELRIYGDKMANAASIYPEVKRAPVADPGKYAHGICHLDDRLYQVDKSGNFMLPKMARAVRVGYEGPRFEIWPQTYDSALGKGPLYLGRFGIDHIKTRVIDFGKAHDVKPQVYHVGGTMKYRDRASLESSNHAYLADPLNNKKYIEPGADSLNPASWKGLAELFYQLSAIYGTNKKADLSRHTIIEGDGTPGQGGIDVLEVGNEWSRDWVDAQAHHSPAVYYTALRAVYLRAKKADPNIKIYGAALTFMDTTYWKALYFHHYWNYGTREPFPCDGLNFNLYLNTLLDGQAGNPAEKAVSPEQWNLSGRMLHLKKIWNRLFPGIELRVTESGVAVGDDSPYDVDGIGARDDRRVAADVELRIKAIAQTVPLLSSIFYYAMFEDGSYSFSSMATTKDDFGQPYGSLVWPMGYALANELYIEDRYNFYSDLLLKGDTTGPWITRKNHPGDPAKKLFKIWNGSMRGITTKNVPVPVGPQARTATIYKLRYDAYTPDSVKAPITDGNVIMDASETIQWLEVTYASGTKSITK